MKAKEYIELFKLGAGDSIYNTLANELIILCMKRGGSDAAIDGVLREMGQKFQAISKSVPLDFEKFDAVFLKMDQQLHQRACKAATAMARFRNLSRNRL